MFISDDIVAKDLITNMLNVHPENRPTLSQIKNHKFFKDVEWSKVRYNEYTPFFIPKLDGNFDTKYFISSNKKQKAFYISGNYETEEDSSKSIDEKFNKNVTQEMKAGVNKDIPDYKWQPLGDFRLLRINKMLKDF